jgi:two-component system cell cycle sensor histidine kinase/response regulator CckA
MLGCQMDITTRKAGELALREREASLSQASRLAGLGMYFWDARRRELKLSPELHGMVGIEPAPSVGAKRFAEMLHPTDRLKVAEQARSALESGRSYEAEFRVTVPNRGQRYFRTIGEVVRDEQGEAIGLRGVVQDFTERLRAEEALRLSESRLARAQSMASIGSWESSAVREEIWWSDEVFRIFGVSPETFRPTLPAFYELIDPEDRPKVRAAVDRAYRTGEPYRVDHWATRPDGTRVLVHEHGQALLDDQGTRLGIAGTVQDITERRRLEEQFFQAQKLESIGRLAGGVAHDFNNLLTVINGYSELIAQSLSTLDPIYEKVNEIRRAGERAAALTRQLLAFSRKQMIQPGVLNLNTAVQEAHRMIERLVGERIRLVTRMAPDVQNVVADAGQIHQVLLNLVVNARDAMPEGGELTIRTANVEARAAEMPQHTEDVPYVCLEVSDTGCGMDAETRSHMFEPFFTTKEPGKGTGLGLSTVYGIVRQSNGWVTVSTELGHGSTFRVYLPASSQEAILGRPQENGPQARGSQTILVVEDQSEVRTLAAHILRDHGYQVLEAADAETALLIVKDRPEPIHLVLTDMVMPGLSGSELAKRLSALQPGLRTIYMSGYSDPDIARTSIDPAAIFVQKPFTPQELASKVKLALA